MDITIHARSCKTSTSASVVYFPHKEINTSKATVPFQITLLELCRLADSRRLLMNKLPSRESAIIRPRSPLTPTHDQMRSHALDQKWYRPLVSYRADRLIQVLICKSKTLHQKRTFKATNLKAQLGLPKNPLFPLPFLAPPESIFLTSTKKITN